MPHELTSADSTQRSHESSMPEEKETGIVEQTSQRHILSDADDPLKWSKEKKALHIYVLSALAMATTVGVSSFAPAIESLAEDFDVSSVVASLPLTLYVVGQALGPCLAAPLSEEYGRKAVFLFTTPIGLAFAIGCGFSQNIATICILRFFAGVFASPSLSVGGGIIADILKPSDRSAATAVWVSMALSGTALGPVLAGYAVEHLNWRWSQWIFIFVTLAGWIPSLFTSESYKKVLLARQARKAESASVPVAASNGRLWKKTKIFLTVTILRPFAMLVVEPIVMFLSIYMAVVFTILFSFFDAFPIVFSEVYGFSLGETGLSFFGLFIGVNIGLGLYIWIDRLTFHRHALKQQSTQSPEKLLYPGMLGSVLLSVSVFWFGWSARTSVHWISCEIAMGVFGVGTLCLTVPFIQYLLHAYGPLYGASAIGANNLFRYAAGGVAPLYTRQMYASLSISWAVSLLGFVTVALLPVPFILFKYGESIRARSSYKPNSG